MKFSVFNGMPYGRIRDRPGAWPVPNRNFEPAQAMDAVKRCLDEVEYEDELGYDWIACAEHHYSPFNLAPNVTVLAATLVQRVKRAKIAILGALIPLTGNPVRIAEEFAMIDTLSGGRLVAGLLRGAPYEYLVYNVPPSESRSRFEEGWDLILRAWTDTMPFGWEGRHYHYKHVSIWPRPIQQPTPPIYVSGSSRESGTFAARKRVGLGLAFTNLPLAAEAARHYRDEAAQLGWTPTAEQIIYQLPVVVADSDEQAFDYVRAAFALGAVANDLVAANRAGLGLGIFRRGRHQAQGAFRRSCGRRAPLGRGGDRARHHAGGRPRYGGKTGGAAQARDRLRRAEPDLRPRRPTRGQAPLDRAVRARGHAPGARAVSDAAKTILYLAGRQPAAGGAPAQITVCSRRRWMPIRWRRSRSHHARGRRRRARRGRGRCGCALACRLALDHAGLVESLVLSAPAPANAALLPRLAEITAPCLLLQASKAPAPQQAAMEAYQERIPRATRILFYGDTLEATPAWTRLVADFIDRGEQFVVNAGEDS